MDRRQFLRMMLSSGAIISLPLQIPVAVAADDVVTIFHAISQALTGRPMLDPAVSQRLYQLLAQNDRQFTTHLIQLADALRTEQSATPEALVAQLSDQQIATAFSIIAPWYLGYTGEPANTRATDNAHFVSFLSALMYEPTADITPRPSYSRFASDYWQAVPAGVVAPPMPPEIAAWGKGSPRAAAQIPEPEPAWLAMVEGRAKTHAEAQRLLSNSQESAS